MISLQDTIKEVEAVLERVAAELEHQGFVSETEAKYLESLRKRHAEIKAELTTLKHMEYYL